jgi:hypothetical protein
VETSQAAANMIILPVETMLSDDGSVTVHVSQVPPNPAVRFSFSFALTGPFMALMLYPYRRSLPPVPQGCSSPLPAYLPLGSSSTLVTAKSATSVLSPLSLPLLLN